jgi:hypothetical protein
MRAGHIAILGITNLFGSGLPLAKSKLVPVAMQEHASATAVSLVFDPRCIFKQKAAANSNVELHETIHHKETPDPLRQARVM